MRKGQKMSEEIRHKLSVAHKANPRTVEHCRQMAEAHRGTHPSLETLKKLSASRKGKSHAPPSLETRQKISASLTGKHPSPETIRKSAQARKGRIVSAETRLKQSLALKGRVFSPESCHKMSESQKQRLKSPELRKRLSETHRGRHPSLESRLKMSTSRKGKPLSLEHNRKVRESLNKPEVRRKIGAAHKGIPKSPEQRKKMSEALKGKYAGPNSHSWKGGISFEPYTPAWTDDLKERIRERDGHTCQLCYIHENGRRHSIHHISYNKKSSAECDLVTTCIKCNAKVNRDRPFWTRYFQSLMWTKYGIDYPVFAGGL